MPEQGEPDQLAARRRPGRPRKWESEAERARAYRNRKADEHASVDELRVERRVLRRQLSDALRGRQRAEAAAVTEAARADVLAHDLVRAEAELARAQADVERLRKTIEAQRPTTQTGATQASSTPEASPGLSRQQRRANERRKQ